MEHKEILVVAFPAFLAAIRANPGLRTSLGNAMNYWLADGERKYAYQPGRTSLYRQLIREARSQASPEQKVAVRLIEELGNQFLPLE